MICDVGQSVGRPGPRLPEWPSQNWGYGTSQVTPRLWDSTDRQTACGIECCVPNDIDNLPYSNTPCDSGNWPFELRRLGERSMSQ